MTENGTFGLVITGSTKPGGTAWSMIDSVEEGFWKKNYEDLSSKDLSSKDLSSKDLSSKDLSSKDLGSKDLSSKDLCSKNLCSKDLGSKETLGWTTQNDYNVAMPLEDMSW